MEHPTDVEDTFGHGTQVATLAAAPANGKGSVGVSPNSHVIVVRVTLRGESFNMACAFNYLATIARDQPMVVNVSITFSSAPPGAQAALDRLIRAGALVVAAAGNTEHGPVEWPANAPHVLAVGRDDGHGSTGSKLDLVAPGGSDLVLPDLTGGWTTGAQGTSYSSPIVAGAAARVWGPLPIENPQAVTYLLRLKAKRLPGVRAGLIDIRQSLAAGLKSVPPIDDVEPNDRQALAQVKRGCARTCTLQGLVTKSDDPDDYWRLSGRRACRTMKVSRGVKATCFPGPGGRIFVRVHAKRAMALYSIVMR
jgi:subtilisin family serine protease